MSVNAIPLYDKTGREILVGDVLKVFHFTGRRKKQHFMYKQVADTVRLGQGENSSPYFFVAHLDMSGDGYHLPRDGSHLPDYEIVQSIDARFEDRPRIAPTPDQTNEQP